MSDTEVPETVARPVRTTVQLVPAAVITEVIDAFFWDLDERQYAALLGLLTILFSFLQVVLENHTGKAFLRQVPPKEVPLVSDQTDVSSQSNSPSYTKVVSDKDDHGENVGESKTDPYESTQ